MKFTKFRHKSLAKWVVGGGCLLATGLVSLGACNESPAAPVDRRAMLQDVATNVIVPTYTDVDARAATLQTATAALEASPSMATLTAAQDAWRQARTVWKQSEAFAFGPVESLTVVAAIDGWPAKADTIDKQIDGDAPITPDLIANLGANTKGFFALEYLLFDVENGNEAVLATLIDPGKGARRRAYAKQLAVALQQKTNALLAAWRPDGGNFVREFVEAGNGSKTYPAQRNALDVLVNRLALVGQDVYENQLGLPFGRRNGGQTQPDLERARRSDNSIADAQNSVKGIENVYMGTYGSSHGLGVADVVKAKNEAVASRVQGTFNASIYAIEAIPVPLRTAIQSHRPDVQRAIEATVTVSRAMASEVASILGTTLQFSNNDGD